LFSSSDFVIIFSIFSLELILFKLETSFASHFEFQELAKNFSSLNSSIVFHSLQKPHCHCHLRVSFQQDLQINIRQIKIK
jgi:hypothetical protein